MLFKKKWSTTECLVIKITSFLSKKIIICPILVTYLCDIRILITFYLRKKIKIGQEMQKLLKKRKFRCLYVYVFCNQAVNLQHEYTAIVPIPTKLSNSCKQFCHLFLISSEMNVLHYNSNNCILTFTYVSPNVYRPYLKQKSISERTLRMKVEFGAHFILY